MRTFILLTFIAMMTGCQHAQKCTPASRSMSPFSSCNVRDTGSCRDQSASRPRCDLSNACRSVQSKCQKVCQTPPALGCKTPSLGWKEVRVPVLKLKDRRTYCESDRQCDLARSCSSGTTCSQTSPCGPNACCNTGSAGCCRETATPAMEPTPFLTLPTEAAVPQPGVWQSQSRLPLPQPQIVQQPIASSTTTNLDQRTQSLENQVNQIHSMLQQRHASNIPESGYLPNTGYTDPRGQQFQPKEVIILPPPTWRTMDGVPPIPNSPIERTSGYRSNSGTYRTAGNPPMWNHSPQNINRSMLR
jgi:hypothetical protein